MTPLERISLLLRRDAHIDDALSEPAAIEAIVQERRTALRGVSPAEYATLVERSPEELARLCELIAVPETWLFRYPAAFELLLARLSARPGRPFRALSVACATGAEPMAIAATALAAGVPAAQVHVLGIEPNPEALARAKSGLLSRMAVRDGLPAWAKDHFQLVEEGAVASSAVRSCLQLEAGSAPAALETLQSDSFDAVFCRNLAIYLGTPARRAIGAQLARLLTPDGLLFLGHAEPPNIFGLGTRFVPAGDSGRGAFAHDWAAADCFERPAEPPLQREGGSEPAGARATGALHDMRAPRGSHAQRDRHAPHVGGAHAPLPRAASGRAAKEPAPLAGARPQATAAGRMRSNAPTGTLAHARAAADGGRLQEAAAIAEALHASGGRSPELLELLGTLCGAQGDHARAESFLRQVVYLAPRHAGALLQLASLAETRGDLALARRYRERAAKGDE